MILLFTLTIILDACGDALMQINKVLAHFVQAVGVAVWILIVYFAFNSIVELYPVDYLYLLTSYALIRFGLFDFIWNLVSGQPFWYAGNTSIFDKIINKLPFLGIWPLRLFCLISGIIMIYKLKI